MRIVLTGGGTGGHVIPNVAIIEELKKHKDTEILYIGSHDGIEREIISKIGVRYESVSTGKLRRYFSWQNFIDAFKVPVGYFQAKKILKDFGAEVVFGKGGFVSVPVVVAASRLKIPVIIHESDLSPGLANKIALRFADKICTSFEETSSYVPKKYAKKVVYTGTLVRESILKGDKESGYKFAGFDKHRPVILVMGGSQGAMQINELVRNNLDELLRKYQIIHVVGRGNLDIAIHKKGYAQFEFLDERMKDVYAMSEMVITRGGANSLFELAILKKRAVVIPLGTEGSRGEQWQNTRILANKMGWSVLGGEINGENFVGAIAMALNNKLTIGKKVENGVKKVVEIVLNNN